MKIEVKQPRTSHHAQIQKNLTYNNGKDDDGCLTIQQIIDYQNPSAKHKVNVQCFGPPFLC